MLQVKKWTGVVSVGALVGVLGFAGQTAIAGDECTARQTVRVQKVSDLIGKSVVNPQGEKLGEVQDFAIDAERGRVLVGTGLSLGTVRGLQPARPDGEAGMQVLTRGPVHEAFAETIAFDPEPNIVVNQADDIEQFVAARRADGTRGVDRGGCTGT